VLDLSPVPSGSTSRQALQDSVALAQLADELGYHRYWVAEHHGMPGIASSAPAVLIGAAAAATRHIRVGSGGVMLPNHAPLVVAEQFGMLEALHPGRVDLGLGRAPGTDQRTAAALRRPPDAEDFPRELQLLRAFFDGRVEGIHACPAEGNAPDIWLLGSSGFSAQVAAALGLPFAFAHHFSGQNTVPALELYRSQFRPSERLEAPYAMVCAGVLCAPTDAEAVELAWPGALSFVQLRSGRPGLLPSRQETAEHPWTPAERRFAEDRIASQEIGSPTTVVAGLQALQAATGADELMVTTATHDPAHRTRSYQLLADAALGREGDDGKNLFLPLSREALIRA
jgi:luciferase family oxidoreductase group 1